MIASCRDERERFPDDELSVAISVEVDRDDGGPVLECHVYTVASKMKEDYACEVFYALTDAIAAVGYYEVTLADEGRWEARLRVGSNRLFPAKLASEDNLP